jgi:Lung seven transmembrane receptor
MDIVLFQEPASCSNTPSGCDWTTLGIGAKDSEGDLRWCCSQEAIDFGFCSSEKGHLGRLIVNTTLFRGEHRFIMFPNTGIMDLKVHYPQLEIPKLSGKYALVIANCNDDGRDILITGEYSWESAHGYLPGDLFGEMYFFYFLASLYFVLSLWYGVNMKIYEDAIIPLQKWILGTILLGLLETFFRSGDYFIWNEDGTRFASAMYLGVIIGVFKRGLSRCLILMVSLGWGVVRDKLDQLMCIVVLGVLYMISAGVRDVMTVVAVVENETLSIHQEVELFDFVTVVTFIVAAIDVTFYMWILDALGSTMVYLETMNQRVKLSRYLRLRFILLLSVLFSVMWSVFTMVNSNMETTMLTEDQMWAVGALMEINYLVILITVAILWRPNENAKDLAYVMELPSLGRGDDDNGLELTSNVPSALDDDDDDEEEEGNFQDEPSSDVKSDKQRFA